MILVDTSLWIELLRSGKGRLTQALRLRLQGDVAVLTRFSQLELLQGAKDSTEWDLLDEYLDTQFYVEAEADTWRSAARIYFDLRRQGLTVNGPIDCCIAQIALENDLLLLHRDKDFEVIARVRPFAQVFVD